MLQVHNKHHPHYFAHKVNREVNEVFWHTALYSLAQSFIFIFEPIYLFGLGFSLIDILIFYAAVYAWYMLFIGFGAKLASIVGFKHSILFSNIAFVIYWVAVFSIRQYEILFYVAPIFFAIQKSLLWPAYDADTALGTVKDKDQEGREVGVLASAAQMAFVAGPIIGGFVSNIFGFAVLFTLASVVMLVSAYPLFRSREIYPKREFSFRILLEVFRKYKQNFFGYWGYAEDMMMMTLWPVFMFIVIADVASVGIVSTTASLISIMIMLYVGKLTDRIDKRRIVRVSALITGALWMARVWGRDLIGVLAFDTVTKGARSVLGVPMIAISYENEGGKGPAYALAYGVFLEFSLSVGKVITALGGIVILTLTGNIFLVFAFAGLLTLLYTLIK